MSLLKILKETNVDLAKDIRLYPPGHVLIRQGEAGTCAYMLLSGMLKVEREVNGKPLFITEVKPVNIVGEMSILSDSPRSATVTVVENAKLLKIEKIRIKTMIRRYPDIGEALLKLLCAKLNRANEILEEYHKYYIEYAAVHDNPTLDIT
ncbi:MAG: cyclic nucleotide-binding domain-containing protein [Candidatus Omnitrophota bacterium]